MTPELDKGGTITLKINIDQRADNVVLPKLILQEVCERLQDAFGVPFTAKFDVSC